MAKLKVKNVGPIKTGYQEENGFVDFNGVTVFIGNQGSGKSTFAKVFSTLSWIEKALVRGDFTESYLTLYRRFQKQLSYQNISNYLNDDSVIEYYGAVYKIIFAENQLSIEEVGDRSEYIFPKIMYIPAERNFVTTVERPDLVKRLPLPLYTFLEEYDLAKQESGEGMSLPFDEIRFEYRKQNKKSWLVGKDFKIDLLEASSGFQSLVPLLLVTKHLTLAIKKERSSSHREISVNEEKKIRKEVDKIFSNKNISDEVRKVLLEKLSSRFSYECFINVVEEPEQNLFPTSQKDILFQLLNYKNQIDNNNLIITTHSPYIINYLTLAVKAFLVKESISNNGNNINYLNRLEEIVPVGSVLSPDILNIYQLTNEGSITKLPNFNGIPSDSNFLNEFLAISNEDYDSLIEIEEQL